MERPSQRVSPRWGTIRREGCIRLPLHGLRSRRNRPPPCPRDAQERPSETRHHRTHPLNGQHVYTLPSAETVPLAIRERQSGRQSGGERQSGRLPTEPPAIFGNHRLFATHTVRTVRVAMCPYRVPNAALASWTDT